MKRIVKKLIPRACLYLYRAIPEYYYDLIRYYRYSATSKSDSKVKLRGRIIMAYHIIEKGLTMPDMKPGYGKSKLLEMINLCMNFIHEYGLEDQQVNHAVAVMKEYSLVHNEINYELDKEVLLAIQNLSSLSKDVQPSRQRTIRNDQYFEYSDANFPQFALSRSSLRNYSGKELPMSSITEAVDIARNTPSACNRQASQVYVFANKDQIKSILDLQGGNRGFGHLAEKLIVITAELGVFADMNERNQAYIDGGMFAMNLLYSLHSQRIAACILNCSHTASKDRRMRSLAPIKESEVYIAMITCGNAPEEFKIALSPRKYLEEYLTVP